MFFTFLNLRSMYNKFEEQQIRACQINVCPYRIYLYRLPELLPPNKAEKNGRCYKIL